MKEKEKTIESYNKNAKELSDKFRDLMELKRGYEFQRFIDLIDGKSILDLGCGAGDHSVYFMERGFDVTAIDLSEEMVMLCREKGVGAFVKDIEDLDFDNSSFDGIWAVTSLLHIRKSKLRGIVEKLNFMLRDDGIFYVCVKEGNGEGLVEDKFGDGSRFFAFWREDELLGLFGEFFDLIENKKVQLGNTVFLQAFFRKK